MNKLNATLILLVVVVTIAFGGWTPKAIVPTTPDGKGVKDGGSLVVHDTLLYAFQGHNTQNFFAYNPLTDTWESRHKIPYALKPNGKPFKKGVKMGGALVVCEDVIYAFKGGNTSEFWMYNIAEDTWIQKASILGEKKVKHGGALVLYNGLIYAFKGGKTDEFWVYYPENDSWAAKAFLVTSDGRKIKGGGALVVCDDTIYAFVGGNTNHFYAYTPNAWIQKPNVNFGPDSLKKRVKDGATLNELGGYIYAFKGGNSQSFGYFNPSVNAWFTLDTIPRAPSGKRVKHGGSLTSYNGVIYALKGGNTKEFWAYTPLLQQMGRTDLKFKYNTVLTIKSK